jgi:cell wall-associated NlpC family hydrolase
VGKLVGVIGMAMAAVVLAVVVAVAALTGSGPSGTGSPATGQGSTASGGVQPGAAIPPSWVTLYQQATATCPGLPWSVVAAIGTVESDNGRSTAPGVASGANAAGAEGPMQFEPATFAVYATVGPGGVRPASPYDPVDAVYSAAAMLCANGAGTPTTLHAALLDYNHSGSYADTVLTLSLAFGEDPSTSGTVVAALSFAARQLGTPYVWGGTGDGGFDCSGLSQAAYRSAGIALPRVAQAQFTAGPPVAGGATVTPGDLIFFGTGPSGVDHVGLYVGAGEMIDAPFTGALVRFDVADQSNLVGATDPGS